MPSRKSPVENTESAPSYGGKWVVPENVSRRAKYRQLDPSLCAPCHPLHQVHHKEQTKPPEDPLRVVEKTEYRCLNHRKTAREGVE